MRDARLALLVLLALGLAVYAGLREADQGRMDPRRPTELAREASAPDPEDAEEEPIRLLAPWHEHDEDWWVPPTDEDLADPGPPPPTTKRTDPMALPDLRTWRGSRASLKTWLRHEIARLRGATPGTPAAERLAKLRDLLTRILDEETPILFDPPEELWRLRPFGERPWRAGDFRPRDPTLPAGSGIW